MTELDEAKYSVVLHDVTSTSDLGEMTEGEVLGFVERRKASLDAAISVLWELQEKGKAATYIEAPDCRTIRVEIERIANPVAVR
jgi:hypothetical protein